MSSPPVLANVADVEARAPQSLTDAERARVAVLLVDATALAFAKVPDIPDPPPATAVGVVCSAVLRALASPPDGVRTETVGGYSRTLAHEGGGLYFTEDELDLLRPTRPLPRGAFSIWTVPPRAGGG